MRISIIVVSVFCFIVAVILFSLYAIPVTFEKSTYHPTKYPTSDATFVEVNNDVGCHTPHSNEQALIRFNLLYKKRWFIWSGKVNHVSDHYVSIVLQSGQFYPGLRVNLINKHKAMVLTKGKPVTVQFLMEFVGNCDIPFEGAFATIL